MSIRQNNKVLTVVISVIGALLIAVSAALMAMSQMQEKRAGESVKQILDKMYSLIPEISDSVPDDRENEAMPMLEIDGKNYIGVIEVPAYEAVLPICGMWDDVSAVECPCRFTGSVYGEQLVVGGSDNEGQFDFMDLITVGDEVFVTDVTGGRYKYTVGYIEKTGDVSAENLKVGDAELTLFAKNSFGLEYTVVRCTGK